MSNVERPEWIQPGAEVVRWSSRSELAEIVKIKSVGKMWITLDSNDPRIEIRTLKSAYQGSRWSGWYICIAERNSPEAINRLNRAYVSKCAERARAAYTRWDNDSRNQRKIVAVAKAMSDLNDAIILLKESS